MHRKIHSLVSELMIDDGAHGMDHVDRVYRAAMRFADAEGGNRDIIGLAALLHDADDYKLFGQESADNLTNATRIMNQCDVPTDIQTHVKEIIRTMGYSRALTGIRPTTIEGKIVSDADMFDDRGATAIARTIIYGAKINRKLFDRNIWPNIGESLTIEKYKNPAESTTINHFFEKLLLVKNIMLTESGRREMAESNDLLISFLRSFFTENNAPEWIEYLDNFLAKNV